MDVLHGIILSWNDLAENRKAVNVFTREQGFQQFAIPTFFIKRKNQPINRLQIVEIEYAENKHYHPHRATSIAPTHNNYSIYFDIYKMNVALLWSETLSLLLRKEEANPDLYSYLEQSVLYLQSAGNELGNFNLMFYYRLAALIGFRISSDGYTDGAFFDLDESHFTTNPSRPHLAGCNASQIIHRLLTCRMDELGGIVLDRHSRSLLLDLIFRYYTIHLNVDFSSKSIRIIREIFD